MRTRMSLGLVLALVLGSFSLATIPTAVEAQSPFPDFGQIRPTLLNARLTGAAEAPGPGDPDGLGFAGVIVLAEARTICYALTVSNIATATAAHIHRGAPGVAGPIVVELSAPSSGSATGCATDIAADLIAAIVANPRNYYVNVHNAMYPAGAVRGQLAAITDSLPQ